MADVTINGTGSIASTDYSDVTWTGKTKAGKAVVIKLSDAINLGNIDWTMQEKDDVVAQVVYTATYSNTNATATTTAEPWEITLEDGNSSASGDILLGVGVLKIGTTPVALCRGGGSFNVEREFREINADGDRGPVKDRIVMESSRATLTMNVLSVLNSIDVLYTGVTVS